MCEKFEFKSEEKSRLPQLSGNRARSGDTSIYTYYIIIIYLYIYYNSLTRSRSFYILLYMNIWIYTLHVSMVYYIVLAVSIYSTYTRMALSMAFTRCKTYNIAFRDRICIRYTSIISCTWRGDEGRGMERNESFLTPSSTSRAARANGAHVEHRGGVSIIRRRKLSCGTRSTRSIRTYTLQSIPIL